ncbi:DJ-1/PfpI family protein [Macrococcus animalis]|uniref:DJ-1/PfpI family protein n=1 Tax=Macrococcus animalis TaxID=3395467 RepID=UPI0039BE08B7
MNHYIFIFKECALFEVTLLANFIRTQGENVVIVGDEEKVKVHEGFTIVPDILLNKVEINDAKSFTITGGNPGNVKDKNQLKEVLLKLKNNETLIGAICGGVHILSELLSIEYDLLNTAEVTLIDNLLVSPPNKYVDFALKMLEELDLYNDQEDYDETVRFFKEFKSE